jgi:1-pyrroline-5-carboxylate dehydrogenase
MEELHRELDSAIEEAQAAFGRSHPMFVAGREVCTGAEFDDRSPVDTRILLGRFQKGTRESAKDAVTAARSAYPAWSQRPWWERVDRLREVANLIRRHRAELSALVGYEAGKNRLESIGEVEEAADLIAYYCDEMELNEGYRRPMGTPGSPEQSTSVLRPYGVWAVISPFNFPIALAAGPAGAALLAGNTVIFKPTSETPYVGLKLYEMMAEVLPEGVFQFVTGSGSTVGQELVENSSIDGIVFTGSRDVGMGIYRANAARPVPRPLVIEMGGKNPALVMGSADLDKAADGVMRSAFGAQGQKCSACSRVYVERGVRDRFVELLVEKTRGIRVGNPLKRETWLGPVISEAAVRTYEAAVDRAKRAGGRTLTGGRRLAGGELAHGFYVEPTIVDSLPPQSALFQEELFVPILVIAEVADFDEAIERANATEYGLTAGIFSEDEDQIGRFFERIEAGVAYANRRAGATTGAWPGVNSFGGWKTSGSTGRGTGGPHYVQQFLREQSQTRVR